MTFLISVGDLALLIWALANDQLGMGPRSAQVIFAAGELGQIEVAGNPYNGVMPAFSSLSDAEIAAVLTQVRSQWGNSVSAITAADVSSQRANHDDRGTPWTAIDLTAEFGDWK